MKYKIVILQVALALMMVSCKTATKISSEYSNYSFQTECMGVDPSGAQTLRTWGKGKNKAQAIERAKKNALQDVIFKGITAGGECEKRPLLNEVNAQEKYSYYFYAFFQDGGVYSDYVKLDEKRTSRIKSSSSDEENWGVVVTVDRMALRQKLIEDNILKP